MSLHQAKIIAVVGTIGRGKNFLTDHLIDNHIKNGVRCAFADEMKLCLWESLFMPYGIPFKIFEDRILKEKGPRDLMIGYGQIMRDYQPDFFIRQLEPRVLKLMKKGKVPIISDVRYENELEWIQSLDGISIKVEMVEGRDLDHYSEEFARNFTDYDHLITDIEQVKELCVA